MNKERGPCPWIWIRLVISSIWIQWKNSKMLQLICPETAVTVTKTKKMNNGFAAVKGCFA